MTEIKRLVVFGASGKGVADLPVVQRLRYVWFVSLAVAVLSAPAAAQQPTPGGPQPRPDREPAQTPTFRSGIELVTLNAVVRDHRGRPVTSLAREDFALVDDGRPKAIVEFKPGAARISAALLIDSSGSMDIGYKSAEARTLASFVLGALEPSDEVALYAFDSRLIELRDFTTPIVGLEAVLDQVKPFGLTSLYDAIAETARRVAARGKAHSAVVVLTDGIDTGSKLTAPEVSGIASAIDVPIYVIAVTSPLDHPGGKNSVIARDASPLEGELANLAHWTGGEIFISSQPSHMLATSRQIVGELRHQYLIAFEPGSKPGWHPLELRVRDSRMSVRARGGYFAGQPRSGS